MNEIVGTRRWWLLMAALAAAVIVSPLLIGFQAPYWRHADQDLVLAYHGLLFGDGLPQEYFDHPGYGYFLVIAGWYRLLHALGLLPVHALSALPAAADTAAWNAAWQQLVEAGRALSMALCAAYVVAFATMMRRLVADGRVALLAGIALAFGVGVASQSRQMRTDLVSGVLMGLALMSALLAARGRSDGRRLALLALTGAAAALAVVTKLQALFPALALPVLALPWGRRTDGGEDGWGWGRTAVVGAFALALAIPTAMLVAEGITQRGSAVYGYHSIGAGLTGVYQGILALWVTVCMVVYARIWGVRPAYALAALAAVGGGVAAGLLTLHLRYDLQNVIAVANPVEHMFVFSSWKHGPAMIQQEQVLNPSLLGLLLDGLWRTLAIRTVVLHPDNIPQTLILEWFAIVGIVVAWRRGDRGLALTAGLPLLAAWGLETLFSLRGFQRVYAIYTDPLVVLAAAAVLARFSGLLDRARDRRRIVAVMALYVALAHVWPIIEERRAGPAEEECYWFPTYMKRLEPFPFCRP